MLKKATFRAYLGNYSLDKLLTKNLAMTQLYIFRFFFYKLRLTTNYKNREKTKRSVFCFLLKKNLFLKSLNKLTI